MKQSHLIYKEKSHIDISCLLNFSSQSNFIQVFKKYKHMTPKQYQDSMIISSKIDELLLNII